MFTQEENLVARQVVALQCKAKERAECAQKGTLMIRQLMEPRFLG